MAMPSECPCESGEPCEAEYDGYGIFMFYFCSKCYDKKRSKFRTDIFEQYETDEPIEDDY
jgi:hypothetical protein